MTQTKLWDMTKQPRVSMPHGLQGLPNDLPLMKEEVRQNVQILKSQRGVYLIRTVANHQQFLDLHSSGLLRSELPLFTA